MCKLKLMPARLVFPDSRTSRNGMEPTEHQAEETREDITEDPSDEEPEVMNYAESFKIMSDEGSKISDKDSKNIDEEDQEIGN